MYENIYYQYFLFSKFFRDNVPGSILYNSSFDAAFLLSLMEFLNLVVIGTLLKMPVITTNHNLDMFLLALILIGLNLFYFKYSKRYIKIIEQCDKEGDSKKSLYRIFTIIYSIISFLFFYLVHPTW
jgi:hypothetical protein